MYEKRFGSSAASPLPAYDASMLPGTRVRYSGKWLANTGQRGGSAGAERFTVRACDCDQCVKHNWVCVDRSNPALALYSRDELIVHPELWYLHIARVNLSIVGKPTHRDDP